MNSEVRDNRKKVLKSVIELAPGVFRVTLNMKQNGEPIEVVLTLSERELKEFAHALRVYS